VNAQRLGGAQAQGLIAARAVGLFLQLRLSLRMLTDEIPGPRERRRSGFVARDDQSQHFIDEFLVAHGCVGVAIAARHQHGEKIEMLLRRTAAAIDQLRDQLRQRAKSKGEFQVAVLLLGDDFERIRAELLFQAGEVAAENRPAARFPGSIHWRHRSD